MGIDFSSFLGGSSSSSSASDSFWPTSTGFNLANVTKTLSDVTNTVANGIFQFQNAKLDLAQKKASIANELAQASIQKTYADTSVQLAKIQAQNALKSAQQDPNSLAGWSVDNINNALANLNARMTASSSGNNIMLWLTVAGVGFAALQYFKRRG